MTSQIQPLELQIFKATKLKHRKTTLLFFQVANFWAFWSLALVSKTVPFFALKSSVSFQQLWVAIVYSKMADLPMRNPLQMSSSAKEITPEIYHGTKSSERRELPFWFQVFFANVRAFGVLKLHVRLLTQINVAFCLFTLEAAPSQTPLSSLSAVLPSEACGSNDASWRSWPSEFVSMNKFRRGLLQRCWFLQESTGKCKNLTEHLLEWPFVFLDFHTCAVMMQSRQRNSFPTHGRPVPWCLVVVAGGAYLVTGGKHTNVGYI